MGLNNKICNWVSRYVILQPQSQTHLQQKAKHQPKEEDTPSVISDEDDNNNNSNNNYNTSTIAEEILRTHFHSKVYKVFKEHLKFSHLTSIQLVSLPVLADPSGIRPLSPLSSDIVLTAPTGQGKTLCYVIPIISSLLHNPTRKLRALVIAPTRELVTQISQVFSVFTAAAADDDDDSTNIRVCALAAVQPFVKEVRDLKGPAPVSRHHRLLFLNKNSLPPSQGPANVVVATPGRFLEHYHVTSSATAVVLHASGGDNVPIGSVTGEERGSGDMCSDDSSSSSSSFWRNLQWIVMDEADRLLDQGQSAWIPSLNNIAQKCFVRPRKIIASATMTQNPEKLMQLALNRAFFFLTSDLEGSYSLPLELKQYWIMSPNINRSIRSTTTKSLALLYLLHQLYTPDPSLIPEEPSERPYKKCKKQSKEKSSSSSPLVSSLKVAIFCSSKLTATTLSDLLACHFSANSNSPPVPKTVTRLPIAAVPDGDDTSLNVSGTRLKLSIQNFTSNLSQRERARIVSQFDAPIGSPNSRSIDIIVCSDVLARGLDLQELQVVINYDPPSNLRSYIHRVGRTARAGRHGTTFTLLSQDELTEFTRLLKSNKLNTAEKGDNTGEVSLWDLVAQHKQEKKHLREWQAALDDDDNDDAKEQQQLLQQPIEK